MFIFYAFSPYVSLPFLRWVKFVVVVSDRFFFIWEREKSGPWSRYTGGRLKQFVTIAREFAWADSVLVVLDEWTSCRVVV